MQIKIISPTENQTILGDKVTLSFITSDFVVGQDGYLYLWLDNPIEEASTAAQITSNFDYTLSDVLAGFHRLTLEAVRLNKQSFYPPVKQTVSFNTKLAQILTTTPSPTPGNILSVVNSINWQYILIIMAVLITTIGLALKFTFGKPKIWQ